VIAPHCHPRFLSAPSSSVSLTRTSVPLKRSSVPIIRSSVPVVFDGQRSGARMCECVRGRRGDSSPHRGYLSPHRGYSSTHTLESSP
jgi:hypothetical protein